METLISYGDDESDDQQGVHKMLLREIQERFKDPDVAVTIHDSLGFIAIAAGTIDANVLRPECGRLIHRFALINVIHNGRAKADLHFLDKPVAFRHNLLPTQTELDQLPYKAMAIDEFQRATLGSFEANQIVLEQVFDQLNYAPHQLHYAEPPADYGS